jgi:hypothetical protein
MSGKGSIRRPADVSEDQIKNSWDSIFNSANTDIVGKKEVVGDQRDYLDVLLTVSDSDKVSPLDSANQFVTITLDELVRFSVEVEHNILAKAVAQCWYDHSPKLIATNIRKLSKSSREIP